MKFSFLGQMYNLGFGYPDREKGKQPKTCVAFLRKDEDNEVVAQASSVCSEEDSFNYETGRKIALNRMLKSEKLGKTDSLRRAITLCYNSRKTKGVKNIILTENNKVQLESIKEEALLEEKPLL